MKRLALPVCNIALFIVGLSWIAGGLYWAFGCLIVAYHFGGAVAAILSLFVFPSLLFWMGFHVYETGIWNLVIIFGGVVSLYFSMVPLVALKDRLE